MQFDTLPPSPPTFIFLSLYKDGGYLQKYIVAKAATE